MDTADRFLKESAWADGFDIAKMVFEMPESIRNSRALLALAVCYRRAEKDEKALIPSYLQAAIENAMRLIVEPASPYAERRAAPRYQEQRGGGTDIGPSGAQMAPGT